MVRVVYISNITAILNLLFIL